MSVACGAIRAGTTLCIRNDVVPVAFSPFPISLDRFHAAAAALQQCPVYNTVFDVLRLHHDFVPFKRPFSLSRGLCIHIRAGLSAG